MMGNAPAFFGQRFGGANIHMAEDLDGIVVDDFAAETLRQIKAEVGLTAGSGSDERD